MASLLIVPAAGVGRRLGRDEPKALVPLLGRPLLSWTLEALSPIPFARIVVAAPRERRSEIEKLVRGRAEVIGGGETRSASVRRAFEALGAAPRDLVCVHDAARPLVTAEEAARVLAAAEEDGAAIAAVPAVDTIKEVEGGFVRATLDRRRLHWAATPQAFRADLLGRALASGRDATDEASLCEEIGVPVAVVEVSRLSFKITTPEDLELAEAILRSRDARHGTRSAARS